MSVWVVVIFSWMATLVSVATSVRLAHTIEQHEATIGELIRINRAFLNAMTREGGD